MLVCNTKSELRVRKNGHHYFFYSGLPTLFEVKWSNSHRCYGDSNLFSPLPISLARSMVASFLH